MTAAFTDEQQMLTLALASYYGVWIPHFNEEGEAPSAGIIAAALATLEPLGGHWKLAWGPVSLRASFGLLDDVLAFVARDDRDPVRYAVVLRGTNPLSLTDWIFGDGWVLYDEPWDHGADRESARISRSSALGLSVILNLRAHPVGDEHVLSVLPALIERLRRSEARLEEGVSRAFHDLAAGLDAMVHGKAFHFGVNDAWLKDAEARLEKRLSNAREGVLASLESLKEGNTAAFDAQQYKLIVNDLRLRGERVDHGVTLAEFLQSVTDRSEGPVEVWVTGHSKGAALATAVAMMLADTPETWDRRGVAALRCTTFAGPTVGNDAFAARVTRVLGGRHRRVANRLDIVPQGWSFEALGQMASTYKAELPDGFEGLARHIAERVRPLRYTQVHDPEGYFTGDAAAGLGGAVGQMIHQHLHAYITNAGLSTEMFDILKILRKSIE